MPLLFLFLAVPRLSSAVSGLYLQAGPTGMFQLNGSNRDLEPGAGIQINFGYDWEKVGLRVHQIITSHDDDVIPLSGLDHGVEMVAWGLDLKLRLMGFAGYPEFAFQPYLLTGFGAYFLTEGSSSAEDDNASGAGGSLGFGLDWRLFESLSLGVENNFHFIGFLEDTQSGFNFEDNGFALYFYNVMGHLTFHF